jgi:hypothetical protein
MKLSKMIIIRIRIKRDSYRKKPIVLLQRKQWVGGVTPLQALARNTRPFLKPHTPDEDSQDYTTKEQKQKKQNDSIFNRTLPITTPYGGRLCYRRANRD